MRTFIFDLDDTLLDTTGTILAPDFTLEKMGLLPGAKEVLALEGVRKILVSAGNEERQKEKIRLLEILSFFEEIHITPNDAGKLGVFRSVASRFHASSEKIVVVGNRVDSEIRYGNICGFITVLLRHGKHQSILPKDRWERPNFTIISLMDLSKVVLSK
ncbi:MAG: hypothetical protein EXS46_01195 [Candidatus Taylorbacteria bacterium]|nr:hypothetical protein [Candidatus Taylorbacteria bacterium]